MRSWRWFWGGLAAALSAVAWSLYGTPGVTANLAAAAIGFVPAAAVTLLVGLLWRGGRELSAMLLGMLVRMAFVLGTGAIVCVQRPALKEAGLLYWLMAYYIASLVLETRTLVRSSRQSGPTRVTAPLVHSPLPS